jgi:hypothetical protein
MHKEINKNQYADNRPVSQSDTALLLFTLASPTRISSSYPSIHPPLTDAISKQVIF